GRCRETLAPVEWEGSDVPTFRSQPHQYVAVVAVDDAGGGNRILREIRVADVVQPQLFQPAGNEAKTTQPNFCLPTFKGCRQFTPHNAGNESDISLARARAAAALRCEFSSQRSHSRKARFAEIGLKRLGLFGACRRNQASQLGWRGMFETAYKCALV